MTEGLGKHIEDVSTPLSTANRSHDATYGERLHMRYGRGCATTYPNTGRAPMPTPTTASAFGVMSAIVIIKPNKAAIIIFKPSIHT